MVQDNTQRLIFSVAVCYYGKNMVNLVGGGQRSIENLRADDRIWSMSHDGNSLFENEVMLMSDNGPNRTGQSNSYVQE